MKRLHLAMGVAGMLLFLLSGLYLHIVHGHLKGMADWPRLMYRSAHIYLMWAAAANLLLGVYWQAFSGWRRRAQLLGSALVLAAPLFLLASFALESETARPARPLGATGIKLAFAGALVHLAAGLRLRAGANRSA